MKADFYKTAGPIQDYQMRAPGYCFITVQIKGIRSFYIETAISPEIVPKLKTYIESMPKPPVQEFDEALTVLTMRALHAGPFSSKRKGK